MLEKSAVSSAPSLTVLREMAKARRRGAEASRMSLLAFGNPALGGETVARAALVTRDEKLDPLPEGEAEVKGLGRLYGAARSKIYIGAEARDGRAKNEAGDFRGLRFATHGVLNNAAPMYSHLVRAIEVVSRSRLPGFILDDHVIKDEVIEVAAPPAAYIARFDVQYVICRFQLMTSFDKQDVAIPGISTRAHG